MEATTVVVDGATWRKSTRSGANGGACVETASANAEGRPSVAVRDTTNRDGGTLVFPAEAWRAFTHTL